MQNQVRSVRSGWNAHVRLLLVEDLDQYGQFGAVERKLGKLLVTGFLIGLVGSIGFPSGPMPAARVIMSVTAIIETPPFLCSIGGKVLSTGLSFQRGRRVSAAPRAVPLEGSGTDTLAVEIRLFLAANTPASESTARQKGKRGLPQGP